MLEEEQQQAIEQGGKDKKVTHSVKFNPLP